MSDITIIRHSLRKKHMRGLTITEPTPRQRAYMSALQCDAVLEGRPMQSVVTKSGTPQARPITTSSGGKEVPKHWRCAYMIA